jgi:radical SAM/Cys-rich protein
MNFPTFAEKLKPLGLFPLKQTGFDIFQMNLGKMCNQTCKHCHVDAGPTRKEIMSQEIMKECLKALDTGLFKTVDMTGGAPEMNPNFRWLVEEVTRRGLQTIVRCNLTIILANPKYHSLPDFFRAHKVKVVSSLPFYEAGATDRQRGGGVFKTSIEALKMLNQVGYGEDGSGLVLDLVYNPAGAFLPAPQARLEQDFKQALWRDYQIRFNNLYTITNMPISRFLDYLMKSGNHEAYMERLINAFNPQAADNVMCRNTLSIGWDGQIYDCDFNQMLELPIQGGCSHISEFSADKISRRSIVLGQHCFGCTAGAGSSCGGSLTN